MVSVQETRHIKRVSKQLSPIAAFHSGHILASMQRPWQHLHKRSYTLSQLARGDNPQLVVGCIRAPAPALLQRINRGIDFYASTHRAEWPARREGITFLLAATRPQHQTSPQYPFHHCESSIIHPYKARAQLHAELSTITTGQKGTTFIMSLY